MPSDLPLIEDWEPVERQDVHRKNLGLQFFQVICVFILKVILKES